MKSAFLDKVDETLRQVGIDDGTSPATLLDKWGRFVAECEAGYEWGIYEYDNDLAVRDVIERLLAEPTLRGYPELGSFASEIDQLDQRFRALLRRDVEVKADSPHWWRRGVLRNAGKEYRRDVVDLYGTLDELGR